MENPEKRDWRESMGKDMTETLGAVLLGLLPTAGEKGDPGHHTLTGTVEHWTMPRGVRLGGRYSLSSTVAESLVAPGCSASPNNELSHDLRKTSRGPFWVHQ